LGNQLITHNALYDLAGATAYTGVGMSHVLNGGKVALKWLVGNVDKGGDDKSITFGTDPVSEEPFSGAASNGSTLAVAYRMDYYPNDATYVGLSGLHGSNNRSFNIMALDAGYTRGDWQYNGQITVGEMQRVAANGGKAQWTGVSGFVGYKIVPRMQLLARADFIQNSANGGGTYYDNGGALLNGLGPERNAAGEFAVDDLGYATTGANLTRLTLGTNYQINANTQWKTEYRLDQSSGYNFVLTDGDTITYSKTKTSWGTSLVLSF
jgi:hypothetical protein